MSVVLESQQPGIVARVTTPAPPNRQEKNVDSLQFLYYHPYGTDTTTGQSLQDVVSKDNVPALVSRITDSDYDKLLVREIVENTFQPEEYYRQFEIRAVPFKFCHKKDKGTASATFFPALGRYISTPYTVDDPRITNNAINGISHGPGTRIYHWNQPETFVNEANTTLAEQLLRKAFPRVRYGDQSGNIVVRPYGREETPPSSSYDMNIYPSTTENSFLFGTSDFSNDRLGYPENHQPNNKGICQTGAFSLQFNIIPGAQASDARPPWSVRVVVGELTIEMEEDKSELKITLPARGWTFGKITRKVVFPLSTNVLTTSNRGERPITITVIPVWNGVLVCDGLPNSSGFENRCVYLRKNDGITDNELIQRAFYPKKTSHKNRTNKIPIPVIRRRAWDDPTVDQIVANYQTRPSYNDDDLPYFPGVNIQQTAETRVDLKQPIRVYYRRCGGSIQFIPVFFLPNQRFTLLHRGGYETTQLKELNVFWVQITDEASGYKVSSTPKPFSEQETTRIVERGWGEIVDPPVDEKELKKAKTNPFLLPNAKEIIPIPIVSLPFKNRVLVRAKYAVLPVQSPSFAATILETIRQTPTDPEDEPINPIGPTKPKPKDNRVSRYPIEFWGMVLHHRVPVNRKKQFSQTKQVRNEEGRIRISDVPEDRITQINVTRTPDAHSGNIVWDRGNLTVEEANQYGFVSGTDYDPTLMLFPRPHQFAGAVTVAVEGGHNTVPGTLLTGLAVGNNPENSETSNTINVMLFGKEFKATEAGGIRLVNAKVYDGWDHVEAMKDLCDYAGWTLRSYALPYRLPSTTTVTDILINFTAGTPVMQAIQEICKLSNTIAYFNRYGQMVYLDYNQKTGINWDYPDSQVTAYNDQPDFSSVLNTIIFTGRVLNKKNAALLADLPKGEGRDKAVGDILEGARPVMMRVDIRTDPEFPWSKMAHFPISAVFRNQSEMNRFVLRYSRNAQSARSTGQVSIPGNANIELFDTFNTIYKIVTIGHAVDLQQKSFTTNLSLEYLVPETLPVGTVQYLPLDLSQITDL